MPVFRMQEVVKFATDVSMSCGPYVLAVNKSTYKKLPEKVQKLLTDNTERYSLMMADAFQDFNDLGKKMFLEAGGKLSNFSAEETDQLNQVFKPIFGEWVENAKGRGLPAEKAVDELYKTLVELGVKKPFAR
jgi:TRAP-type C4-dicarboxylate transport system substrate-binding protein